MVRIRKEDQCGAAGPDGVTCGRARNHVEAGVKYHLKTKGAGGKVKRVEWADPEAFNGTAGRPAIVTCKCCGEPMQEIR